MIYVNTRKNSILKIYKLAAVSQTPQSFGGGHHEYAKSVNLVLPWVQASDEREIRRAFEQALSVRRMGPAAKEMADRHFFETLVRIHRAGEGAPYTGLKPAGRDLGPDRDLSVLTAPWRPERV